MNVLAMSRGHQFRNGLRSVTFAVVFAALLQTAIAAGGSHDFDPGVRQLPARYTGDDIAEVFGHYAIKANGLESTEEWSARAQELPERVCAFRVRDFGADYDANRREFTITIATSPVPTGAVESTAWVLKRSSAVVGTYMSNAFGTVKVIEEKVFGVEEKESRGAFTLALPMAPQRARLEKLNLEVLLICGLGLESAATLLHQGGLGDATGFEAKTATPQQPSDVSTRYFIMKVQLLAVWVLDRETGEIFRKVRPDGSTVDGWTAYEPKRVGFGMNKGEVLDILGRQPDRRRQEMVDGDRVEEWDFDSLRLMVRFDAFGRVLNVEQR